MADSREELQAKIDELLKRLKESEELLNAIHSGDVDALVVSGPNGDRVYTIEGADYAYRVAVETMNEGAITLTLDGIIIYSNCRFSKMVCSPLEKVIGASIYDFVPDVNRAALKTLLHNADKGEIPLLAGDRTLPVYLSASALNISELDEARTVVITDLSDRKLSEEMVAAERLARSIIEQAAEAIVVCNAKGKIIRFSEAASHILGYDPSFRCCEDIFELRTPDDEKFNPVSAVLEGKTILKSECRFERSDGRIFHLLMNAGPLKDKEGRIIGCVITLTDITERHKAREALQKAHDELEQRVRERTAELIKINKDLIKAKEAAEAAAEAKAAFLANMSHELRTPLNAVIGFSSLLLDDNLTEEQKEYIENIRNGGQALLAIISNILELSRAEKDKISIERQPFSLKHLIRESLDLVAVQAKQKGLKMNYTISYDLPDTIIGDHGRLRQVLINLLSNAVKFTDVGGILVSVSSKILEDNKRLVTFAIKDTGIGMPRDKMDRLFEPFAQLEYIISRKRDGAGLGLAICKELVKLMGGEIWAESEEGKGSTFHFAIPAEVVPDKQLSSSEVERVEYGTLSAEKPLSILVAEDNPSNQRVLVEMLGRLGYRADAVADGIEVLQALKIRPYDLIFMDIKMPEMDGLTATKEIRKLWPENGPKVVAITAFAMDGDKEMCLKAGADEYIAKPVKVDDLATLLRNIS
ncbi:MAG: ATP-binding protein [Methanotrichaceae archaeon]